MGNICKSRVVKIEGKLGSWILLGCDLQEHVTEKQHIRVREDCEEAGGLGQLSGVPAGK